MALTKDEKKMVQETHDDMIEIKAVLLGVDGANGLVDDVKHIASSHYKLRLRFWILIGILVGSGILGVGYAGILP